MRPPHCMMRCLNGFSAIALSPGSSWKFTCRHQSFNDDLSIDVIFYLLRHGDTDDREKVIEILMQGKPQLKEQIMTIEQQWRLESRLEGRQEGL